MGNAETTAKTTTNTSKRRRSNGKPTEITIAKNDVDSENRARDASHVETTTTLIPTGADDKLARRDKRGGLIATGYERTVYGDHGPYVVMNEE